MKSKYTESEYKALVEQYSLKSNEICVNNGNSKLGVAVLSVPFPTCVCSPSYPCYAKCYARKGRQTFPNVQGAYYRNFRIYTENKDLFFEQLYYKIKFSGLEMVRYFDSGDIPDYDFILGMVDIAKKLPKVKFMAFTKKYHLVNKYLDNNSLPTNLNIIFSAWDILWNVPNTHDLPVAYVSFKDVRMTPEMPKNVFHCPGKTATCSTCRACWNKKVKSVYFDEH